MIILTANFKAGTEEACSVSCISFWGFTIWDACTLTEVRQGIRVSDHLFSTPSHTFTFSHTVSSHTHSEWSATGRCTRTLILFSGGGHCHKRYCALCDTLSLCTHWSSFIHCLCETLVVPRLLPRCFAGSLGTRLCIEGSQTYTLHTYPQGKKSFVTEPWSRQMIVEMHWPRPYMVACLDGLWMESTITCNQRMWTTLRKWTPELYVPNATIYTILTVLASMRAFGWSLWVSSLAHPPKHKQMLKSKPVYIAKLKAEAKVEVCFVSSGWCGRVRTSRGLEMVFYSLCVTCMHTHLFTKTLPLNFCLSTY